MANNNVPVGKGIQAIPTSQIPSQWSSLWFVQFIKTWLAPADVRNATTEGGIQISGNGTTPATISLGPPITITGSKGGNAALAALITALASQGLIKDETT